jgi:glutaredoxin
MKGQFMNTGKVNRAWRLITLTTLLGGLTLAAGPAMALYKVVGPDGKVTYTDRAPTDKPSQSLKTNGATADTSSLPYEVRQAASRYPVTLYTSNDCAPCDQGRNALKARGVPFTEKTIQTGEDEKALQRLEGTNNLPVLRIGTQQLKGFAAGEWNSFLDAAEYPKQSKLPPNFQWTKPSPLVAVAPKPASAPGAGRAEQANRVRQVTPPIDPASNPTGIRF